MHGNLSIKGMPASTSSPRRGVVRMGMCSVTPLADATRPSRTLHVKGFGSGLDFDEPSTSRA
eukprot:730282-Pyramimonas_sp.AAC.1